MWSVPCTQQTNSIRNSTIFSPLAGLKQQNWPPLSRHKLSTRSDSPAGYEPKFVNYSNGQCKHVAKNSNESADSRKLKRLVGECVFVLWCETQRMKVECFFSSTNRHKKTTTERWRPSQILTPALTIALFDKSAARRLVTPLPIQSWRISIWYSYLMTWKKKEFSQINSGRWIFKDLF